MNKYLHTIVYFCIALFVFAYFPKKIFAAPCTRELSGDVTISSSCVFPEPVDGADSATSATDTVNTANIVLSNSGTTLTLSPGQTLVWGESITIEEGTQIIVGEGTEMTQKAIWYTDVDDDGYPQNATAIASSVQPANGKRRAFMSSITEVDIDDSEQCPDNLDPVGNCNKYEQGGIVNQGVREDIFDECFGHEMCNGSGICSLYAKRVFLSSTTTNGDMNGISGADSFCQSLADSASLGGTWNAWLSDSTTSVSSRFTQSSDPYVFVDRITKVADNWSDLADGTINTAINRDENNENIISPLPYVWTNTNADGTIDATNAINVCSDWSQAPKNRLASGGNYTAFNSPSWSRTGVFTCSSQVRLYCFEQ